jgi:rubrerythrin
MHPRTGKARIPPVTALRNLDLTEDGEMDTSNRTAAESRRSFIKGGAMLSATAIALLAGHDAQAFSLNPFRRGKKNKEGGDVGILNVALGLEHEGIAAYQIGAESGLLSKAVMDVAVGFQSQHKAHRDALIATIQKLGGKPVAALPMEDYLKSAKLNIPAIKSAKDVVKLAQRLELGATNAYIGVIPALGDKELGKIAARLASDEAMHYTALTQALGETLPAGALTFGA